MTEQHKRAIDKLNRLHKENPDNLALIICGSMARKDTHESSDIDLYLVVTDYKFERVCRTKSFFHGTWDPNEFYGIAIDGKIVGMQFLRNAADFASEPTRYSFKNAYTLFSKMNEIDELIQKIYVYPEWEHEKRVKAFYAYIKHFRYIGEKVFNQGDDFLSMQCVLELVFFTGRLILAHNHELYPCRKALFKAVRNCRQKPGNYIEMSKNLILHHNLEEMVKYYEMVIDFFKVYDYPDAERIGLILEDEWAWYTKQLTISEW